MNEIEIIKRLAEKVTPNLDQKGIRATAFYADQAEERVQTGSFGSNRFVRLRAVKGGETEQVEFRRIIKIDEVGRRGPDVVASEFCRDAANALAMIDAK